MWILISFLFWVLVIALIIIFVNYPKVWEFVKCLVGDIILLPVVAIFCYGAYCVIKSMDFKILILVAVLIAVFVLYVFFSRKSDKLDLEIIELKKEKEELSSKLKCVSISLEEANNLKPEIANLKKENAKCEERIQIQREHHKAEIKELNAIISEKENTIKQFTSNLTAFPYMAGVVADFETANLEKLARSLEWGDNKQRQKKVADIRILRNETKELIEKYKIAAYQLEYLKTMYPVIEEVIDTEFSELTISENHFQDTQKEYDVVRDFLSKEEYESLTVTERNQLALDNYIKSHRKTKWQIGRDYEMYVGYKYQLKGYDVSYHGIEKGMEDLGRDLVMTKKGQTLIVQCKYWSNEKVIREKHILQLYGTYICYCIENNLSPNSARCIFVTNITLSDQAKVFAKYLNVGVAENFPLGDYPRIKCNIGRDEIGNPIKIYHLPFDQQYDSTKINSPGEFYAMTVEEAENHGFRRAFKHHYS